ncbi:MAG: HEAT repeat domain-containing protein [Deltaproteobacteria bacterium]|nr:HEAT repeat domain-containing protein [Deltaproteobacteria bacterium]
MRILNRAKKNFKPGILIILSVVVVPLFSTLVRAQATLNDAVTQLNANDRGQVELGIQNLGMRGDPSGIKPLADRIRRGLPPDLLELSIMTLMALGDPSAGPVLFELAMHRRANIRVLAIEAVAAVNPPGGQGVLVAALSDGDAEVRSKAAAGLGEIGAVGAMDTLFRALDRGVLEASEAIGKVITANRVTDLLDYLNKLPLHSLGPALIQALGRGDVQTKSKLAIVERLGEVATPEVKNYLVDFLAQHGETAPPALVRAVRNTIQQIAD